MKDSRADSLGDHQWSQVFRAPELQQLIQAALTNNFDLRIAAHRIPEQQSQMKIVRSQEFPLLTGGGIGAGAQIPDSLGQSVQSPIAVGSFSLSASWNPDFWGLYRKQTEAARAQMLAQTWAQRAVRLPRQLYGALGGGWR